MVTMKYQLKKANAVANAAVAEMMYNLQSEQSVIPTLVVVLKADAMGTLTALQTLMEESVERLEELLAKKQNSANVIQVNYRG